MPANEAGDELGELARMRPDGGAAARKLGPFALWRRLLRLARLLDEHVLDGSRIEGRHADLAGPPEGLVRDHRLVGVPVVAARLQARDQLLEQELAVALGDERLQQLEVEVEELAVPVRLPRVDDQLVPPGALLVRPERQDA